ncbi:MAG TPA: hypothetical protein VMU01_05040 [Rhizomicrobium sp.]|nr:hypothetical protein [Rhizomicrobium sp.]
MTAAASVADAPPPPPCPAHQGGWGLMGTLTPEQRMMRFELARQATANMTDDQRRSWHQADRDKFQAMSEADRQKYLADLTAQWNALPADRQAAIRAEAEKFRGEHAGMPHPDGCK